MRHLAGSKLKIELRRKKILELLNQTGKVSVTELSAMMAVTPATIRNDLAEMELAGCLLRVQGGAVQISAVKGVSDHEEQLPRDVRGEQKAAIAKAIVKMVRDGDTLFINSGTTSEHIALELRTR